MANILMIIAPENFRDEEYFIPKTIFENAGHTVTTASTKTGDILGSRGGMANSDILFDDVDVNTYDSVVFVGGSGSYVLDNNPQAQKIAKDFYAENKLVNAICHAPIIIAKAGLLKGKNATVFEGDKAELVSLGVTYVAEHVVKNGAIITADGPKAAADFANKILESI